MRDNVPLTLIGSDLQFARGVLLLADFEGVYNWTGSGNAGDYTNSVAAAAALEGAQGLKITTRSTGAAANDWAQSIKTFALPQANLIVMGARLTSPDWSKVKDFQVKMTLCQGGEKWNPEIASTVATPVFNYLKADNSWPALASLAMLFDNLCWLTLHIGINVTNRTWEWIDFAGVHVDMSSSGLHDAGAYTKTEASLAFYVRSVGAAAATLYVDNAFVTEYPDI